MHVVSSSVTVFSRLLCVCWEEVVGDENLTLALARLLYLHH